MYSTHDIDAIIAAVGGLPAGRLKFFASHFLRESGGRMIETPRCQPWMVRRRLVLRWHLIVAADYASTFERVDRAHLWPRYYADLAVQCQNLLDSLAALQNNVVIASAGMPPEPLPDLKALKSAVEVVEAWAAKRGGSAAGKSSHGGARRRRRPIFEDWLRSLGEVYEDIFEKQPGFSVNPETGEVGGPFARYLQACLRPVLGDETPSPAALRSYWNRVRTASRAKNS